MVVWSYILCRRHYPIPYDLRRIGEYVLLTALAYGASILWAEHLSGMALYALNATLLLGVVCYAVRRERIDVKGLVYAALKKVIRR